MKKTFSKVIALTLFVTILLSSTLVQAFAQSTRLISTQMEQLDSDTYIVVELSEVISLQKGTIRTFVKKSKIVHNNVDQCALVLRASFDYRTCVGASVSGETYKSGWKVEDQTVGIYSTSATATGSGVKRFLGIVATRKSLVVTLASDSNGNIF